MRRFLALAALLALGGAHACGRPAPPAPAPAGSAERPLSLDQPTAPVELARYFLARRDYDSCLLAIAAQPDTALVLRFQAHVLLAKREGEEAEKRLRDRRDEQDWRELYLAALEAAGDEAILRGDEKRARQFWQEWARRAPEDEAPRAMLIAIGGAPPSAAAAGPTEPRPVAGPTEPRPVAGAAAPVATTSVPAAPAAPSLRGVHDLIRAGRYAEAESLCRQCLKREPASPTAWNLLGISLRQQGQSDAARAALTRSLELDPNQSEVRLALDDLP